MKVIYPGSFNPWTIGHQDIYNRACQMFGEVTIVVAINPDKKIDPEFVKWTLAPLNAPVEICADLVANEADVIVRGVRSGDWEYEQNLAQWNRELGAETFFLCPDPALSHVSSSAVRQLVKFYKSVDTYCVPEVLERWAGVNEFQCKFCPLFNREPTPKKCETFRKSNACRKWQTL